MKLLKLPLVLALFFILSKSLVAGEGMWLPHLLAALNQDEMQAMGMKMTAEDIYSVNQGSLKDAIVHFGGFCTGEIISDRGLLLTNHHCGYGQIQSHSSVENNLLRDGFWAKSLSDELPNPGLFVRFIDRIEDVSDQILAGVDDDMSSGERQSAIDKNIESLKSGYQLSEYEEIAIRPFFKGNQFILFVTRDYPDVRLVGTPPESIGKYGHDTDNWVWPRHTGDFSLFRVYSGPDGSPAEYSENNIPLNPDYSLPVSLDGVEEGDFTLVFGFPGSTDEYLPGKAVDLIANRVNPVRIDIREAAMQVLDKEMKSDETIKIKYASKFARLTNYWKKWIGESMGLEKTNALKKKADFEKEYTRRIDKKKKLRKRYSEVLPDLNSLYESIEDYEIAKAVQSEAFNRNVEMINMNRILSRLVNIYSNNGQDAFEQVAPRYKNYLEGQYKNYDRDVDMKLFHAMMDTYLDEMPEKFVPDELAKKIATGRKQIEMGAKPITADPERMFNLLGDAEALKEALQSDEITALIQYVNTNFDTMVAGPAAAIESERADLMRIYMKAQMEAFPDKEFYPDANGTMRVTYGKVAGYEPRDAVYYEPVTYLDGVIEKYEPGDWEFDLPQKLIDLHADEDYGEYADDGALPVCFIGTNHTTGGNSGSPAIDAHGNLIGLNFDRVWEGTMSDLNYDASICRNIMVDVRYILFIIDKYADAGHLIDEMNIVHPKG